jgi:hypothetical protein
LPITLFSCQPTSARFCKAIFVAHNDEDYAHLHIVASKLNPATGRAYDLKGNWLKLSRWGEQYERDHSGGIVCTRREGANQLRDAIDRRCRARADDAAAFDLQRQITCLESRSRTNSPARNSPRRY